MSTAPLIDKYSRSL